MNSLLTSLPLILPIAYAWSEKQEAIFLAEGIALNEGQLADARKAGVICPEKIRVLRVESLPQPENEDVKFIARQLGLFSERASGLAVGYGICIRHGFWEDRYALVHECVHVGQYEKRKGIRPFLDEYLRECIEPGYPFGFLEQEAIRMAKYICKSLEPDSPMKQATL